MSRVLRIAAVTLLSAGSSGAMFEGRRTDAIEVTGDGFHIFDALYARTGLQDYDDGRGGIIVEYRPDAEVFADESLASYDLRPLTDLHPPRNLTTDTAYLWARGATSAGRRHTDGVHVAGRISVWRRDLIDKFAKAFARGDAMQLSAGYELDLDRTPGQLADGRRYDAVQRNIRINHVAAVPLGRAGTARVLADSFANEWAKFDSAQWAFEGARSLADIGPNRDRAIVDFGRWARHDSASLRTQALDSQDKHPTMKKLTIKVDGQDVVIEHADGATPDQIAALVSKAHGDAAEKRDAARKLEHDAALAAAIAKAKTDLAPPFGKKPEDEEAAVKKDAAHKAELAKVRTDAETRVDVLSTARAVRGISYDAAGKTVEQMRLDVIEAVADRLEPGTGADARKELETTAADERPGAVGHEYRKAVRAFDKLTTGSHADDLLETIRGRFDSDKQRSDKQREPGPITTARTDAEREAALPRDQRTAARKAG